MKFLALICLVVFTLLGQDAEVEKIVLNVQPATLKVRPFGAANVQVKVYGSVDGRKGRIRQSGWLVTTPDGGRVSKPFKFQGKDDEAFVEPKQSGMGALMSAVSKKISKDSVVFFAPEKTGKYLVRVEIGDIAGEALIEVTKDAPADIAEKTNFPEEPKSKDPYRKLVEHYAPFVAQETFFEWKSDALRRFDADGDWNGTNNWDNMETSSSQAYVYYAVIESQTHWFLIYNFFHMRDYSETCFAGTCHENDNEGVVMAVRKGNGEFGTLELMETLAHNMIYSYSADKTVMKGSRDFEAPVVYRDGRPVVFLESGGHGALGGDDAKSTYNASKNSWRPKATGITYTYKGKAERPRGGMDAEVGYELLPIYDHWWLRALETTADNATFGGYGPYKPFGDRPGINRPIPVAFSGVKFGANKARPFWGWFDMNSQRRRILAAGQWAVDPAYAMTRGFRFAADKPMSLDYVFNPYIGLTK
jgi:hypothetical protein